MVSGKKLLPFAILSAGAMTSAAPIGADEMICAEGDANDCYPVEFKPTREYQAIREGQQIPPGLDIRMDWQTGEKFAKLSDDFKVSNEIIEVKTIEEIDDKKVVNYIEDDEDTEEDKEIKAIKNSYGSQTSIDFEDSLDILLEPKSEASLIEALDSLTEHSHNLKDGIIITEHIYLNKLLNIIDNDKLELKELSSRIIAQSLRHNEKALQNINLNILIPKFLKLFRNEQNSVLEKRYLGVISSLIQNEDGSKIFVNADGELILLNQFNKLKEDSKIRCLEILEDLKKNNLTKRSEDEELKLFKTLEDSFSNNEIKSEHSIEIIFDKLVELKTEHDFKTDQKFLDWLVNLIMSKKLIKRDGNGEVEDNLLHMKLLEARHLVFGNPNALRKALADEL